jgi:hypothetical protein
MLGCFRKSEAEDPDTYVTAIGAILAEFDAEVIKRVTDPVRGLPRTNKWPPNPAEVADACDRMVAIIKGERLIAEREAAGFRWIDDRANTGRIGFYNDRGENYGELFRIGRRMSG